MNNYSGDEITKKEIQNRKMLFEYYYSSVEEIQGKPININSQEYEENLFNTKIGSLINYIKQIIPILINKKIDEFHKILNVNKDKIQTQI